MNEIDAQRVMNAEAKTVPGCPPFPATVELYLSLS